MEKRVVILSVVLIMIIVIICLSWPVIAVLGEPLFVRLDIQNPHVNRHFRGWNQVQVENYRPFLIPKEWTLEEDDGIYKIANEIEEVWAYGAVVGPGETHFHDYDELISAVFNTQVMDIALHNFEQFIMMNGSDIDFLQVHGKMSDNAFFCIQLEADIQEELVWILMPDLSLDEAQYDIAEAIVYSYAFGNLKER